MFKRLPFLFFCFLVACTSFPQHSSSYKNYSVAFNHPENTPLGRNFNKVTKPQAGLSGYCVLNNGLDGFIARVQLIAKAQSSLDLQYYIFREDKTGMLLTEQLINAADRGVKIRILVDDGNTLDGDEQLLSLASHPNIQVRIFNPFYYRGHNEFLRLLEMAAINSDLDYRMHNKLFVVDNAVALIGGRNIGDDYFQVDADAQLGDDDVFTIGPMVRELSQSFDEFWNSIQSIPAQLIDPEVTTSEALNQFKTQLTIYLKSVEKQKGSFANQTHRSPLLNQLFSDSPYLTWASAQLIYDSPNKKNVKDDSLVGSLIYEPIKKAVKSTRSELFILSPFFIPGDEGMKLFQILQDHGVSTRVLTNSLESTPELPAHAGYTHYRKPLLKMGVKLFEVRARPGKALGSGESKKLLRYGNYGLHAKQYIFDRQKVFLGSMNFDQRSMHLNTEIGLLIHSPELAKQALERFNQLTDISNSYQVFLVHEPKTETDSLIWVTKEHDKLTTYTSEPSRSTFQMIKANFLAILPIDDEL